MLKDPDRCKYISSVVEKVDKKLLKRKDDIKVMSMLKGMDRCKYISDVIDNINDLIWIKDSNNNLLFANETAFKFLKKLNKNGEIKCPITDLNSHKDEEIKIETKEGDIWIRFSSIPIHPSGEYPEGILIIANDITEEKKEEIEVERILDERISKWQTEKENLSKRIRNNYKEIDEIIFNKNLTGATL